MSKHLISMMLITTISSVLFSCEKRGGSFSLLAASESYKQTAVVEKRKIDILWMIDNSGSMYNSQQNVINNFNSFIQRFLSKNYDFHMAVQTSDAYLGTVLNQPQRLLLRSGNPSQSSGVTVMTNATPDLAQVFMINASQGTAGSANERIFQSLKDTLSYEANQSFRREDAFLAVIILSDEDDFSANIPNNISPNYNHASLIPVSEYKTFLDGYAGVGNYNVNTISIIDSACEAELLTQFTGRMIGQRYNALVDATQGIKASLCEDFGENLQLISDTIASLTTVFQLSRQPVIESIVVQVDGQFIQQDATNGWTYDSEKMQILFHGSAIPGPDADVQIQFDPKAAVN